MATRRCKEFVRQLFKKYREDGDLLKLLKNLLAESRGYQTYTQLSALQQEVEAGFNDILIQRKP